MVKLFLDSAAQDEILEFGHLVQGFTTNPTLMRRAGVQEYAAWGRETATLVADRPISFEVVTDDFQDMVRQALLIHEWGPNVFVKIPITNTEGKSSASVIRRLSKAGIKVNVTAITTIRQVKDAIKALDKSAKAIISVFAGRIADTGVNPRGTMRFAVKHTRPFRGFDVLWASPRQVLDIDFAEACGVDIITVSKDILAKRQLKGRDLTEYSLETVKQFYTDATLSGYSV